jgi:quinoprotein glucose dehydrogenase
MKITLKLLLIICIFIIAACSGGNSDQVSKSLEISNKTQGQNWGYYSGNPQNTQYSPLDQITRSNVTQLKEVWRFSTDEQGSSQTNPLIINGTLYGFTPELNVIALDAAKGTLQWKFDAGLQGVPIGQGKTFTGPSRGLVYWRDGKDSRLFAGVMNYLYALDPETGQPIISFGEQGAVDLRKDLGGDFTHHYVSLTTPGIIYQDLLIVGFRTSENLPAPSGDIRAYDVRTGKLRWTFHTIPRDGEAGADTWPKDALSASGGANSWAGMALDEERGIVYVPTGSAVPDFYGSKRLGDNLYANSLLALDAVTGKRLWHFQTTHHDLWDRDLPAPPLLLTLTRDGQQIDAVAQASKQGFLFLFNRVTGEPLFPIEERAVPPSDVPGEVAAKTQPFPLAPKPFSRQRLTEDLLTTRTPESNAWALEKFRTMRSEGQYAPFSVDRQTVVFPGFDGGAEWGGSAVDPGSAVVYINANDIAWTGGLVENIITDDAGASLFDAQCSVCHGADREGSPPAFPSLVNITERLSVNQIRSVISNGRGRMPPSSTLSNEDLDHLVTFLSGGSKPEVVAAGNIASDVKTLGGDAKQEVVSTSDAGPPSKYHFTGYNKFLDPEGYPAVAPPWGTLNAIDLNTGEYLWTVPLGEYPDLAAQGMPNTGSENYGGPILTASGLVFIAATIYDQKIRAFDSKTGELLWQAELPFAGTATPATYRVDGKQYLVIVTNNARNPKGPQGNAYVAFALSD